MQQLTGEAPGRTVETLTPVELFALADAARDAGDLVSAERAYRALSQNPDIELRTEARFRLGLMLADLLHDYRRAAIAFRQILAEKPKATRVRLELARMYGLLGDQAAARRELRATEAAGLPPEVERTVRLFANALRAGKPLGGSFELSFAPDSNINRATRAGALDTVLGTFTLDRSARAKPGIGIAGKAQVYWRIPVKNGLDMLTRVSASAAAYRASRYDDMSLAVSVGPEMRFGRDQVSLAATGGWRWYGLKAYSVAVGTSADWSHPIGKRAETRITASVSGVENHFNPVQDATSYALTAGADRAFGARTGVGATLTVQRDVAADPAFSFASGSARVYGYRELGRTTLVASLGYAKLAADRRLQLFVMRREDTFCSASLTATFRGLRLGTVAPLLRIGYDRNLSSVAIYAYKRRYFNVGVGAAF
ncbi:surface lipoprotein assembly modifier [Sphingomonas sp. MMS24-J13]|uniref:surface lipoprotein assembly modifier n=1 Tax=Sphingomonas sp. MMS24-J13 TaxID=3238686 RepID=UPI00384BB4A6